MSRVQLGLLSGLAKIATYAMPNSLMVPDLQPGRVIGSYWLKNFILSAKNTCKILKINNLQHFLKDRLIFFNHYRQFTHP